MFLGFARVEDRNDRGMLQAGGDPDLAGEPLPPEHRTELRAQHLHGDLGVGLEVAGEVHRRHPPVAEFSQDRVALGEQGRYPTRRVDHAGSWGVVG
jgi:hypothetical protein